MTLWKNPDIFARMSLFNAKVVEKTVAQVAFRPTPRQVQAAREWVDGLASGRLRRAKETALYGDFQRLVLRELLGYATISDAPAYTLAENEAIGTGAVEFALGRFSAEDRRVLAPLELKAAGTDLDAIMAGRHKTPVQQAWEYAIQAPGTEWVLVSDYVELRIYAFGYGRETYERIALDRLTEPGELARLRLLLGADNLLGGQTRALLEESEQADRDITNRLYRDYQDIRDRLIQTITDQNPAISNVAAIGHAQTILDRVLFIAFAEDTGLLPRETLKRAFEARNPFNPQPIWKNFKGLFRQIDKGQPNPENRRLAIPAYNGGLFAEDPELDALSVPDPICKGFEELGAYDYESEISVSILGHIFEQSITDIEAMQAEARGEEPPQVNKKKREGVVYTPDNVTRFIVEQTLGRYLQERFLKLLKQYSRNNGFPEADNGIEWKGKASEERFWRAYQEVLLAAKVLDPACGSGAFLIAAFDFLDAEYARVNKRLAAIRSKGALLGTLFDSHRAILTNNLYGVDVNIESVEITKLSLWLRTAKRGEALQSLRANIRVGNSLIEDTDYHRRSFVWREAFPEIFEAGGFHVVIGNPPYVRMELIKAFKPYLETRYEVVADRADLYCYFYELGFRLLRPGGKLGFVSSSTFFRTGSGAPLRRFLAEKAELEAVVDFGDLQIFEGVTTYPAIVILAKPHDNGPKRGRLRFLKIKDAVPDDLTAHFAENGVMMARARLGAESWQFETDDLARLRRKIHEGRKTLGEVYGPPLRGIVTGLNKAFIIDGETRNRLVAHDSRSAELLKSFLKGEDLKKWRVEPQDLWLINIPKGKIDIEDYPAIRDHLLPFKERLEARATRQEWYELQQAQLAYQPKFEGPKLIFPEFSRSTTFCHETQGYYANNKCYFMKSDSFLLSILNSRFSWFHIISVCSLKSGGYYDTRSDFIATMPIPDASDPKTKALADLAEQAQAKAEERYRIAETIRRRIPDLCPPDHKPKLSKKLKAWWELDFRAFREEVKRAFKTDIPVKERGDWEDLLAGPREQIMLLTAEIGAIEREIDARVYALFDLTDAEIGLLEDALAGLI